jgi:predicted transcriptional regulator
MDHQPEADPEVSVYRPERPGIRKVLGDLEAEIMELVWARPPGEQTTVRQVFESLYERRRIAYTTVMSTMARLARKRLLLVEKDGQAYAYRPTLSQREFVSRFVERVLESLLVSFTGSTFQELDASADPQAATRLRRLLDEIERRRAAEEEP